MLKRICLLVFLLSPLTVMAAYPTPSQLGRLQMSILSRLPPYSSKGSMQFKESSMPYELEWYGPKHYRVTIKGVPQKLYSALSGPESWSIHRYNNQCLLAADDLLMNCPSPQTWALLELSGSAEDGARGLYISELIDLEEIPLGQTNTLDPSSSKENRVSLVIGNDGSGPAALLSLQGLKTESTLDDEVFPEILVDQTFLTPVLLRVRRNGEVFTIKAKSDLEIRRGRGRYTYVLSEELNVQSELKLASTIRRSAPAYSRSIKAPNRGKTLHQIDLLKDRLSVEGQFLLNSLLMTH